jgi:hypothetical protein
MGDQEEDKLFTRFSKLLDDQTEMPSKKEVAAAVSKFYSQQKKKGNGAAAVDANKPKRAPSAYNIFFKEQMQILKEKEVNMEKDDRMTAPAKMAHIAELWKTKKEEIFQEAHEDPPSENEDVVEAEVKVEVEVEVKVEPEVKEEQVIPEPVAKQGKQKVNGATRGGYGRGAKTKE